jgi:succinate-semialdehyde dehydrogenase/glutarate-semialdehyde dehydrogenase
MIQSLNPANGILLRSFEPLTPEALAARLAIASSAAKSYPRESLDQRIFWMRRLAALLEGDLEELAALMTAEMGKTLSSARQEVRKCADVCRYYADNAARILAPEPIKTEHLESFIRFDPLGVILAVMPWNFPLWQVFRFAAPALMAGNVGLLKHASNVPQCALAIEALIRRAGFPRGTFQTLLIDARQVEHLLADDRVAAVTVTGSEAAGRAIAAQAGWLIKKSVLELGGSDPFLVLSSADLDLAVPNAVKARCINNGQSCIAAKRFLIHDSLYDEFERRFTEAMAALRVGDPTLASTEIGPIATPQILDELLTQVSIARAAGGKILTGGSRLTTNGLASGNYFQPTVIAGVSRNSPICKAEIFGPVALLFRITSLEEAIALANDTPFGLAASAWTSDPHEQQRLAAELQCGAVFFNQTVASDPRLPFGGIKRSGYGRELSAAGMREFLNAKTVVVARTAATQQQPSEPTRTELPLKLVSREGPPSEFSHFADQIRKFEPRKPQTEESRLDLRKSHLEDREPKPKSESKSEPRRLDLDTRKRDPRPLPSGLKPIVFETKPDPIKMAPIVWDAKPDERKLAPIVWDNQPEERRLAPIVNGSKLDERKLAPTVIDSAPQQVSKPSQLAPIVFDSTPEPRRMAPIVFDSAPEPRKMPKLIYGNEDDKDDDKPSVPGSILGL